MDLYRVCVAAAAAVLSAGAAAAQAPPPDPQVPMTQRTEKIGLSGRKGESLFRPGFGVGEYTGVYSGRGKAVRAAGVVSSDSMRANFTVTSPGLAEPIVGACQGGEASLSFAGITFDRDDIQYDCSYQRGATPAPDMAFHLALSKGTMLQRFSQMPQRAAEMVWGGRSYRAVTKRVGGMPLAMSGVLGYVVSRDGVEIGGLDLNGLRPNFYLPVKGDPDRDAVAVMTLTLFFFQDPARAPPK